MACGIHSKERHWYSGRCWTRDSVKDVSCITTAGKCAGLHSETICATIAIIGHVELTKQENK